MGRDTFADLGAEAADGTLLSLFDLGFAEAGTLPYQQGFISDGEEVLRQRYPTAGAAGGWWSLMHDLPQATGVTLGRAHGTTASIARFRRAYPEAEVESMEGAAAFWVAFRQNLPALQLRAVSNYVAPRDRASWQIERALTNLTQVALELLVAIAATEAARADALPPPNQ